MPDRIPGILDRLRDNERVTALQGKSLDIVIEDLKKRADRETVEKLDQITRDQLVPDVAVLKAKMDTLPTTALDRVLSWAERLTGRRGFRFTLACGLLFGAGWLLDSCSDRLLDIAEATLAVERRGTTADSTAAVALEDLADELEQPLSPDRDTVAVTPADGPPER